MKTKQSKLFKKLSNFILSAVSLFTVGSVSVYAQITANNPTAAAGANLLSLVDLMQVLVTRIIPLTIGATVLAFFLLMIKYMFDKDGAEKGKMWHYMMYSVVVLFVEVSIWGLVAFLGSATGIKQGGQVPVPEIPTGVRTYDPSKCITRAVGNTTQQCCKDANNNYVCQ